MKESSFITTIKKDIETKQKATAGIREEIANLEAEIKDLVARIDAYTDVNDVKTYSNLKDNLEIRQHKLEVLRRDLSSETNAQDPGQAAVILNGFISEKRKLDDAYGDEMLEEVRKLNEILTDATEKREELKRLFDTWVTVFRINTTDINSYPMMDETGISGSVQKLINSLNVLGKI